MPRRRRDPIAGFVRELGDELPSCFGFYEPAHPECDGDPPCAARTPCRVYRDLCARRGGVDPRVEREVLSDRVILGATFEVMRKQPLPGGAPTQARVLRGWDRFRDALAEALPASLPVHDTRELAVTGELYVQLWQSRDGRMRAGTIRVRGFLASGSVELPVARYWPEQTRRICPSIEVRADLRALHAAYPAIEELARRWSAVGPSGRGSRQSLGSCAVGVYPERIEDVARLFVRALERRLIRGVRLTKGVGLTPI